MANKLKYLRPAEATADGLFPRSTLRRLFRLKPAPGQRPAGHAWQGHCAYPVFRKDECVAIKPYRAPSQNQLDALTAGRSLIGTAICRQCGGRADSDSMERGICYECLEAKEESEWRKFIAGAFFSANLWKVAAPLFLDTETTGLGDTDQVIELSVLDEYGEVLFSKVIRPTVPVHPEAAAVNGWSEQSLAAAQLWPAWHAEAAALLNGRLVICHNAEFDRRLLEQTCAAYGLEPITATWGCTMDLLTPLNDGRRPNLARAAEIAGVEIDPTRQHRSEYDADVVRRIVAALATRYEESQ